jgi:tetraacyldisaccharide 4'-kinase
VTAGPRLLFVTNGHGEAAIAARIAQESRALGAAATDHFPLVGRGFGAAGFPDVGPRRAMPSGGLVAMGNVRAFAADLRAGWPALFAAQLRFLSAARSAYDAVVAVGDAYAAALARRAGRPLVFVGTAKSVYVAGYGMVERRILAGARRIFVRDPATAADLQRRGLRAEAPGNVIVDLLAAGGEAGFPWSTPLRIAILPGSRPRAYADAARIADVIAAVRARRPEVGAALSLAPTLDPAGFAGVLAEHPEIAAWTGPLGGLIDGATLVIGQAGTANEAAAANGVPVVALELDDDRRDGWYRMRQERLLGEAMLVVPGSGERAADQVAGLLDDEPRRARMGRVGRARMGAPGGAAAIAGAIRDVAEAGR